MASLLAGSEGVAQAVKPSAARSTRTIHTGFVILNGKYLPSPYVLSQREDELLINAQVIALERNADRGPPKKGKGGASRPASNFRRNGRNVDLLRSMEEALENDALLIGLDGVVAFSSPDKDIFVLKTLLSDAPKEAKAELLAHQGPGLFDLAQWTRIVGAFEPTPELAGRVEGLVERLRAVAETNQAAHERAMQGALFRSGLMRYGVTIVAMALAVIAVGTLLIHRPDPQHRWREIDHSGDGVSSVVRNVVLLVLLGLLDLGLTLTASQAGGFWEVNPLGNHLEGSPLLMVAFKTATLLLACSILVMLRRYRGAQLASWWLCLTCTILAFRWLTYNSMFMI